MNKYCRAPKARELRGRGFGERTRSPNTRGQLQNLSHIYAEKGDGEKIGFGGACVEALERHTAAGEHDAICSWSQEGHDSAGGGRVEGGGG